MDGLTIIDGVSIAVVLLSGILAYARGFLREVLAISGWIISIIIAFMLAPTGVPLVSEIPYLNKIVSGCEATTIISFALILAISVLVCSIFTPLLSNVVKRSVFLGKITKDKPTLAIAGTHGKTTTTAILAHLFSALGESFTAFIGGVMNQKKTNLMLD